MRSHPLTIASLLFPLGICAVGAQQPTPPPPAAPAPVQAAAPPAAQSPAPTAAPAAVAAGGEVAATPAKPAAVQAAATDFQHRMANYLLNGITLTAEQKTKLDSLMGAHRQDRAVFGGTTADSASMEARVKMVRRHMAENRAVLTEDQQKIYDRNLAQMRELFEP